MIRYLFILALFCASTFAQTGVLWCTNAAQLASLNPNGANRAFIFNPGGSGFYVYDAAATDATNNTAPPSILKPNNFNGRWIALSLVAGTTVPGLQAAGVGGGADKVATNNGTAWNLKIGNAAASKVLKTGADGIATNSIYADTDFNTKAANLLDVASVPAARSNLVAETRRTFNVTDYGGVDKTGATDSTLGIRAVITAAGTNATLVFPKGVYVQSGRLEPLAGQEWIGKEAILKRCNEVTVTTASAITTSGSPQTVTVASTNGFFVGMDVSVFNGGSFDANVHSILSMTSTTITISGGFTTAFASGGTIVTVGQQIGSANAPGRVTIQGFEIDGNKANNTSLNKWELHAAINLTGAGTVIRDNYIHDCPSEGIEGGGQNSTYEHNRIIDCNGNGIHFSTADHVTVNRNYIKNCNLTGASTGHSEGCITWSALNKYIKITDNYLENGLAGLGNFRSENARTVIITGNTITNCTYALEGNMASPGTSGDITINGNQFFNSGQLALNNTSVDPSDTAGHYNVTIANNLFENTKIYLDKTKGVVIAGNVLTNSTTTDILVQITDGKDVLANGNLMIGGGYGFYVTSDLGGGASNGTNNVNIAIRNNTLRNQYTRGIDMNRPGIINGSALGNTVIAQTGAVNAAAYVGIFVNDGSAAENNFVYVDSGLYGIQLGAGVSGFGGAVARNNLVKVAGSVVSIRTSGGSSLGYIHGNLVSVAINDAGSPNNFVGFNPVIGEPLRTGAGVMVGSTAPLITNAVLITPTIASLVNANHTHQNAAGGGTLDAAAIVSGQFPIARLASGTPNGTKFIRDDGALATPAGGGDVTGPASSVDSELALFSSTTGKLLKRATSSGIPKLTSGVLGNATAGSGGDYLSPAANEFGGFTLKGTPTTSDVLLIEDAAASGAKKRITIGTLPGGGGGSGDVVGPASSVDSDVALFSGTTGKLLKTSKVALTQPATAATITIANNKTFTVNKSITLEGTDSTTITLPASTASVFSTASGEYSALTSKSKPTSSDLLPIEDAAASNAKKKITIGNLPVMQRLSTRHWRMAQPIHGGDLSAMGMGIFILGTSSTIAPTSTEPVMINYASAATTGSTAGMHDNGNHVTRTGRNIYFAAKVKLQETAATRVWIGLFFSGQATVLGADTLGDFMGFRYSTVTSDTNWKACNGLVSQTTTDSGVAVDTNIHLFEIVCDDSVPNIKFYVDGALVATNTTNLPSADNLQVVIGEATQANVAKNIRVGWIYVEDDL